jgi:hypothetical protein
MPMAIEWDGLDGVIQSFCNLFAALSPRAWKSIRRAGLSRQRSDGMLAHP